MQIERGHHPQSLAIEKYKILHHAKVRRQTRKGSNLRAQGEEGRVAWACGSHEGAKELPRSQGARRFSRRTTPPRGKKSLGGHPGRLAGGLGKGLAGRLPWASGQEAFSTLHSPDHEEVRRNGDVTIFPCHVKGGQLSQTRRSAPSRRNRAPGARVVTTPPLCNRSALFYGGHSRCKSRIRRSGAMNRRRPLLARVHPLAMPRPAYRIGS